MASHTDSLPQRLFLLHSVLHWPPCPSQKMVSSTDLQPSLTLSCPYSMCSVLLLLFLAAQTRSGRIRFATSSSEAFTVLLIAYRAALLSLLFADVYVACVCTLICVVYLSAHACEGLKLTLGICLPFYRLRQNFLLTQSLAVPACLRNPAATPTWLLCVLWHPSMPSCSDEGISEPFLHPMTTFSLHVPALTH